jgi:Fic/DOC family protein
VLVEENTLVFVAAPLKKPINFKIAEALTTMNAVEVNGIVRGPNLPDLQRKLLRDTGFLEEIIKGWYCVSNPLVRGGSTAWMLHFWAFLAQYLESRFGEDYCLSSEASLRVQSGLTTVPTQISVIVTRHDNNVVQLPGGKSIFPMRQAELPQNRRKVNGVWCMSLESALALATARFFTEAKELAVGALQAANPQMVLRHVVEKHAPVLAARLAGAYQHIGRPNDANQFVRAMEIAGYTIKPENPFNEAVIILGGSRTPSPYRHRIRTMWASHREQVLEIFPIRPEPIPREVYLQRMDDVFVTDAYNSLSIEGYRVSRELIAKIASGEYNPHQSDEDRQHLDAMAARGYWETYKLVRDGVGRVFDGEDGARVFETEHHSWNVAMCGPMIEAGMMQLSDSLGYRNNVVMIKNSNHVPPPYEAVVDCMEELMERLQDETEPCVRAILGHFFFVFIHPLPDRNGRLARFMMNMMLASASYPWTVVRVSERQRYLDACEAASFGADIRPFTEFIAGELKASSQF